MLSELEDQELIEQLRKEEEKEDFKSVINKKKISKWELDKAFLGET